MEKPRIRYADFMKRQPTYLPDSLADWIERLIKERNGPGGRPILKGHEYTLRLVQRAPIAAKHCTELKPIDFLGHARVRKAGGVKPQTIVKDMTYASGVIKYAVEIWEIPGAEAAFAAYRKAIPQLKREQLIAKAEVRTQRPTPDQLERLLAHFALPPKRPSANWIPMVPILKMSYLTGRRISETCRITWADIDHDKKLCTVRDLKNSKGKGFHGTFPLLGEAYEIVMAQPRTSDRVFPYNPNSCSQKFIKAKKALGIEGIRLHDNRRHCFSGMFEGGYSVPEVQQVSLHANATVLLKNYTKLKPEDLHRGPASKRDQVAA